MTIRSTLIALLVIIAVIATTWLLWHAEPEPSARSSDAAAEDIAPRSEGAVVSDAARSALESSTAAAPVASRPALPELVPKPPVPARGAESLTIRVVSAATGEPLPRRSLRFSQAPLHEPRYVTTGPDGRATFDGLSAAEVRVAVVELPRFPRRVVIDRETIEAIKDYLTLIPQGQEVDLVVRTRGPIEALVLGPDGAPLPDVGVACVSADGQFLVEFTDTE